MTKCSRCSRSVRNPVRWAGLTFGSTCAKAVGAAAVQATRASARRQRAAHTVAREVDLRQVNLFPENT